MELEAEALGWKQHFPTYHFKERDVALEEYRFATKTLEAEERVFLNAANLSVIVGAALGSLALGNLEKLSSTFAPVIPEGVILFLILLLSGGFAVLALRYFADRQKAVVFAARKVIVLRRMLGMSYGSLQLVLPNWRVEGADEPFAVRLFPGWHTYVAYPCHAIAGIAAVVAFFVIAILLNELHVSSGASLPFEPLALTAGLAALFFLSLSWTYRKSLLDVHEPPGTIFAMQMAKTLSLRLVSNMEYVIYRATLGTYELRRIGVDLEDIKTILIHIEDKEFYSHRGVSAKGLARLMLSIFGIGRRAGGSTITQQLVRTLFIVDQTKLFRRKFIEIALALSFNKVLSKNLQLEMYLSSVRFERSVFGVAAALKYFFGHINTSPSKAEAFFLVERISNIRSKLLVEKIDETLHRAVDSAVLSKDEAVQVVGLYVHAIKNGSINDPNGAIERLQIAWSAQPSV